MANRQRVKDMIKSLGEHPSIIVKAACLERFMDVVEAVENDQPDNRDGTDYLIAEQIGGAVRDVQAAMRGKLNYFSTDHLVNVLDKCGIKVTVTFSDKE